MSIKKILYCIFAFALVMAAVFAIEISAATSEEELPKIYSKNISYEGDLKFVVAIPTSEVEESVTFTVSDGVSATSNTSKKEDLKVETIYGTKCYTIKSGKSVSQKDMAKNYELTITVDGKISLPIEYSVAEYLYERLFEDGTIDSDEGTVDYERRALYLSTLEFGKNAEQILYNRNDNPDDDVLVHVDELYFTNLTGETEVHESGDKILLENDVTAIKYKKVDGVYTKEIVQLEKGEFSVDAHYVVMDEPIETFDSDISTSYISAYVHNGSAYSLVNTGYYTEEKAVGGYNACVNGDSAYYDRIRLYDGTVGDRVGSFLETKVVTERNGSHALKSYLPAYLVVPVQNNVDDGDKTDDAYVFETDIYIESGKYLGELLFLNSAEGRVTWFNNVVGSFKYDEKTANQTVSEEISGALTSKAWHKLKIEIYANDHVKVYVDGVCLLDHISRHAASTSTSPAMLKIMIDRSDRVNVFYDNMKFVKTNKAYTE